MKRIFKLLFFSLVLIFFFWMQNAASAMTISPASLEASLAPGQSGKYSMVLFNETSQDLYLDGKVELFKSKGEDGQAQLVSGDQGKTLSWIKLPVTSLVLKPGEYKNVYILVDVPSNASVAGYYYAILWRSSPVSKQNGQVGMSSQVGCLLLLDVKGEKQDKLQIVDFKAYNDRQLFIDWPISFTSRLQNDGNTHLKPQGSIILENFWGQVIDVASFNPKKFNILPQSVRKFDSLWLAKKNSFVIGPVSAKLVIEYGSSRTRVESKALHFWVIPWKSILIIIAVLALLIVLTYFIKRKKK